MPCLDEKGVIISKRTVSYYQDTLCQECLWIKRQSDRDKIKCSVNYLSIRRHFMGLWLAGKDTLFSTPKMYFLKTTLLNYEKHNIELIIIIHSHSITKHWKLYSFYFLNLENKRWNHVTQVDRELVEWNTALFAVCPCLGL